MKKGKWAEVVYYDSGTVREVAARLAETCRQYLEAQRELEAEAMQDLVASRWAELQRPELDEQEHREKGGFWD